MGLAGQGLSKKASSEAEFLVVIGTKVLRLSVPLTFSFAQLAKGKSLGRSKPATNSQIQALATHCVDYFYYIQALLNCLL
jgi:hypothetical protein